MSQLLDNYESSRKAIFNHCGVEPKEWWHNVQIENCANHEWCITRGRIEVRYNGPLKSGYFYTIAENDGGWMIFRGKDLTLVLVDSDQSVDAIYEWLAIDNSMEVKC